MENFRDLCESYLNESEEYLVSEGAIKDFIKNTIDKNIVKNARRSGQWVRKDLVKYEDLTSTEKAELHNALAHNDSLLGGIKQTFFDNDVYQDLPLHYGVIVKIDDKKVFDKNQKMHSKGVEKTSKPSGSLATA